MKHEITTALVRLTQQIRTIFAAVLILVPFASQAGIVEMFETDLTGTALDSVAEAEAVIASAGEADFTTAADTIDFSGDSFPGPGFGLPPSDGFVMRVTGLIDTDLYDQLFMEHDDGFTLRIGGIDFFAYDANLVAPIMSASGLLADNGIQTFELIYWDQGGMQVARLSGDADITNFVVILTPDSDGDGILDNSDNCPNDSNPDQNDFDADGLGDACDPDDDNDGVDDSNDAFPFDPTESDDNDGDGVGDSADLDDDNDGQSDNDEIACGSDPLNFASVSPDADADNVPDCVDMDDDNDGVDDDIDVCPNTSEEAPTSNHGLGKNRWSLLGSTDIFTQAPPQAGSVFSLTTTDTGGCSCSQIVLAAGLGRNHLSRGCSTSALLDWISSISP